MIVGVPKEIKDNEARVGVTPAGVKALTEAGHKVLVETQAGAQSGFPDAEYQNAGAEMVGDAGYAWGKADMVVKVKEPIESEYVYFRDGWFFSPIFTLRLCPRSPTSCWNPRLWASLMRPFATAKEICRF